MFQIIKGGSTGVTLEDRIKDLEETIPRYFETIQCLYYFSSMVDESYDFYKNIKELEIHLEALDVYDLISEFYPTTEREFAPDEEKEVKQALAISLAELYYKDIEDKLKTDNLNEENLANIFYTAIEDNYPNPNDFIFEYKHFQRLQDDEDPMKKNLFSFWILSIYVYGTMKDYFKKLVTANGLIKQLPDLTERIELRRYIEKKLGP